MDVQADGTFSAFLRALAAGGRNPSGRLRGRWLARDGLIVTTVTAQ